MTNKEIEKFIKKNIIGHLGASLIQKGTYILMYPFYDILGGFCFEPSATDKNSIYIWWFVQPLFIPDTTFSLTFGNRFEDSGHNQVWSDLYAIENIEKIKKTMIESISFISSLTEPEFFYEYYSRGDQENIRIYEALVYVSIWINSPNWRPEIKEFIKAIDGKFDASISWIKEIKDDMISIESSYDPKTILEDRKNSFKTLLNI